MTRVDLTIRCVVILTMGCAVPGHRTKSADSEVYERTIRIPVLPTQCGSEGKDLWVGRTEVTYEQIGLLSSLLSNRVGECNAEITEYSRIPSPTFDASVPYFQLPVTCITQFEAQSIADYLSHHAVAVGPDGSQLGSKFRLPSREEWRCFSGKQPSDHDMCRFGNFWDNLTFSTIEALNELRFPCADPYRWRAPVGKFAPNEFGLYDVWGNVAEWTSDNLYYLGGSFRTLPSGLGPLFEAKLDPSFIGASGGVGLRVVLER